MHLFKLNFLIAHLVIGSWLVESCHPQNFSNLPELFESPMPDPFTLTPFPAETLSSMQTLEQIGVQVYGRVALKDGSGLPNAQVYLSLAAYSGEVIAMTDHNGEFPTTFIYISGDENVTVWVESEGYSFIPPYHIWRHYHGLEKKMLIFTAFPDS